ncbi:hypothetical protein Krac_3904 [Ktedonobacter racemifer DSM 44963]|uniref:Uncharacterized protein n=1 Tax=Ktedonobacter racemifer DSM 44963 TaxID=485913 RepID=D6U3K5_KTERA|nr:hypothetical protein Krac_3904 [Ktedonobacter racemifer DSM 44963]
MQGRSAWPVVIKVVYARPGGESHVGMLYGDKAEAQKGPNRNNLSLGISQGVVLTKIHV